MGDWFSLEFSPALFYFGACLTSISPVPSGDGLTVSVPGEWLPLSFQKPLKSRWCGVAAGGPSTFCEITMLASNIKQIFQLNATDIVVWYLLTTERRIEEKEA